MKSNRFSVSSRVVGDAAVIYPVGYLNNLAGECLVEECTAYIQQGITKFVLNLKGTNFINSIGISLLLNIIENLKDIGGTLCFTEISKVHSDTFDMLGLTPHMLVFQNETEAFKHLNVGGHEYGTAESTL